MQITNKEYKHLKFCELFLAELASDGLYNNINDWNNFRDAILEIDSNQYDTSIEYLIDNYEEILDDYKNRKTSESK